MQMTSWAYLIYYIVSGKRMWEMTIQADHLLDSAAF